jgi:DNA-binding response OmpR family regulator
MRRAIIVESDAGIRKLQSRILRQHAAADAIVERSVVADALGIFSSEHFDFAMVDISRPSDELREFLDVSRSRQKSPVIAFTTGVVDRDTMKLLVTDHVFAVFPKPFELEEVAASVRAAIAAAAAGTLHPKFFGFLKKRHDASE